MNSIAEPHLQPTTSKTTTTKTCLAFGTYRLSKERAADSVTRALQAGIRHIDSAQLYRNEDQVFAAIRKFEDQTREHVFVTTKIYKNALYTPTIEAVKKSRQILGRPLDRVLLHRPLPNIMWRALNACIELGLTKDIGVSNYGVKHLEALLRICDTNCLFPSVNQVEFHPFVGPVLPLLSFCKDHAIQVQGHTMLARGLFFDFSPLAQLSQKYKQSPAATLLRWAKQLGVDILFHSNNSKHIQEIINLEHVKNTLSDADMAQISGYHCITTRRFFNEAPLSQSNKELDNITNTEEYITKISQILEKDRNALSQGLPISETALELPTKTTYQLLTDPTAQKIALILFPPTSNKGPQSSYNRYRELIRQLRNEALKTRQKQLKETGQTCQLNPHVGSDHIVAGLPVSTKVSHPSPMPVTISTKEDLEPFFHFLANPKDFTEPHKSSLPVTFLKGTYFPDQRMDLCKQVVGPTHIEALCEAIIENHKSAPTEHQVRHFLLGNNIACEGEDTRGAQAIAELMANSDIDIETWYLAGNEINSKDMQVIASALEHNTSARALWLKRNPLGPQSGHTIGQMLAKNKTLSLLDLNNTGLFDEGIETLCFANQGQLHLRHLYLCANGLTSNSIDNLALILKKNQPISSSISSLYLSLNRFMNEGLDKLTNLIKSGALKRLRRLDLGSNGFDYPDLTHFVEALIEHCPLLQCLDLGTYKSTRDMGEKPNILRPDVSNLVYLLKNHRSLQLLDVTICGLPEASIERLVENLGHSQSLEGIGRHALKHTHNERRYLRHPRRVFHIDSIYRGR